MRTIFALLISCLLVIGSGAASAAMIEGVRFADRVQVGERELPLRGTGLLRYRVVFRAYVAALYLPGDVPPERVLADVPRRLELEYFWAIAGVDFGRAAEQLLARALPPEELRPLRDRLERLHALYTDVEPGDRYALEYAPGTGTTLRKNGTTLGTIPGADFAAAYFGIWLGAEPLDGPLRDELLGVR